MIDVKKLVTGFLILAVAVSATAFLISTVGANNAAANGGTAGDNSGLTVIPGDDASSGTVLSDNAFLPQAADDNSDGLFDANPSGSDPALDASSSDPNNLTTSLANAYLTDLMSANPDGPTTDANGDQALTPPDSATVVNQLEGNATSMAVQIPDWDAEAAQIPIITISTSSPDAISNYSSAIQSILNQDLVATNIETMLNGNSDPSAASYIQPKIQSALQDIAGLQTPAPLVSFQKSLIAYLVYGKNTLALTEGISSSSDPLKDALVLQAEAQKYDTVAQSLNTQLQQDSALTGFAPFAINSIQPATPSPTGVTALINKALGLNTAYAIFGLGDITFDPSNFEQLLINYAKNIALQLFKNLIIYKMQETVLAWIRGSGTPQFIQNWGTTLVTAYTSAAINALNSQFSCVNPAFQSQLKVLLKIPGANTPGGVCAAQFSAALTGSNLTNFYNNFSKGGFVSYMAVFQPSGNLFGSAIDAQDAAMNAGLQNYASVQTKSTANQGWTGKEICVNSGTDPNTGCKPGDALFTDLNGNTSCITTSGTKYPVQGNGGGTCPDGSQPQVQQPGQVTGQVFNSAVDSSGNLTAAANDIAGLFDTFTTSLLNSIASNLITVSTGALENIGSTGNGTPGSGQSGQVPISCTPTFQNPNNPFEVVFIGAGGQTMSVNASQVTTSNPVYSWTISGPGGANPSTGAGGQFDTIMNASGTYIATITDTTPGDGDASAQCSTQAPAPSN